MNRRVELLDFASGPSVAPPSVIESEAPQPVDPPPQDVQSQLVNDFTALRPGLPLPSPFDARIAQPEDPGIVARTSIPLWMRTGVASSAASSSPTLAALPFLASTCSEAPYRPRGDLPTSTEARRARLFPLINAIACEAGLPAGLFDALIGQESRYHLGAVSPKGAIGLAQLMPGTARQLGVANPWDPVQNLRGGALYLRQQLNEFGRIDLALAAYNAGPGRVRSRRAVPRISETVNYVSSITRAWSGHAPRRATIFPATTPVASTFQSPARSAFRTAELISWAGAAGQPES